MLHVRVVSPAALTGPLTDRLAAAPGVHNVVVHPGAARQPDGDAVQFDGRDAAANPVFTALRELGLDRDAVIGVERVDATLTGRSAAGGRHGALRRETAPVWEMVEAVIRDGETYAPSFYVLLAIAALIGAVGIIDNSEILIVGAMVVGPEYNAIIGVALGITRRARSEIQDGLLALFWGFLAAIALTLLFGLAVRVGQDPRALPQRGAPGRGPDQQPQHLLGDRGRAGRAGGRGIPDRGPGQRAHRRVHLGDHHPGRRLGRPVDRVRELERGTRLSAPAPAQRFPAHRGRRGRAAYPARDLGIIRRE
jgi:hypothetical protein